MTIIFSFLAALGNALRGHGYKVFEFTIPNWRIFPHAKRLTKTSLTKPLLLTFMAVLAYIILPNIYYAILCPIPLAVSWSWKGGTGSQIPKILAWFNIPFIREDYQWRAWEFTHVFVYCLVYYSIGWYV